MSDSSDCVFCYRYTTLSPSMRVSQVNSWYKVNHAIRYAATGWLSLTERWVKELEGKTLLL